MKLPSGAELDFSGPALVMGIVNCNDDSFYPPSRFRAEAAVGQALRQVAEGASIIDFGAESSRPGAAYISAEEELERLIPVVEAFRGRSPVPVSLDTRKAAVAKAGLEAGADIVNDISALADDPGMADLCAGTGAAVVLMHKKGSPPDMQNHPEYDDAAGEVFSFLLEAAARAEKAGIKRDRIILDPGIGFGKTLQDNLAILNRLAEICASGYPVLVGLSRKTFVGELLVRRRGVNSGRSFPPEVPPPDDRLSGTLAAEACSVIAGAKIVRAHDVKETWDLVKVLYGMVSASRLVL
jgi:dihydropteroate synthase